MNKYELAVSFFFYENMGCPHCNDKNTKIEEKSKMNTCIACKKMFIVFSTDDSRSKDVFPKYHPYNCITRQIA